MDSPKVSNGNVVRLAIQNGYKFLDIFEVYEYMVIKYDPHTREGGLFADYINTFLKLEAEGSGTVAGFEPQMTRKGKWRLSMLEKSCS